MSELVIPAELKSKYTRLMRSAPAELRNDPQFEKVALMYLKLGGEKLARLRIEIERKDFQHEFLLVKKRIIEEESGETEEAAAVDEENEIDL